MHYWLCSYTGTDGKRYGLTLTAATEAEAHAALVDVYPDGVIDGEVFTVIEGDYSTP